MGRRGGQPSRPSVATAAAPRRPSSPTMTRDEGRRRPDLPRSAGATVVRFSFSASSLVLPPAARCRRRRRCGPPPPRAPPPPPPVVVVPLWRRRVLLPSLLPRGRRWRTAEKPAGADADRRAPPAHPRPIPNPPRSRPGSGWRGQCAAGRADAVRRRGGGGDGGARQAAPTAWRGSHRPRRPRCAVDRLVVVGGVMVN